MRDQLGLRLRWLLRQKEGEQAMAKSTKAKVDLEFECGEGNHRSEQGADLCNEYSEDKLSGRDEEWFHEHVLNVEQVVRDQVIRQAVDFVTVNMLSVEFLELIEAIEQRDDDDELQEVYHTWRTTVQSKDALKTAAANAAHAQEEEAA